MRDKLVKQRSGFKSTLTEMKAMLLDKESPVHLDIHESMCKSLNEEIEKVEKELLKLIKEDDELQKQFNYIY